MTWIGSFRGNRRPASRHGPAARPRGNYPRGLTLESLEERTLLTYAITDLGTLGGNVSYAHGINNRGQVVGGAQLECNCMTHPFLWAGGALHDLGAMAGAASNWAFGVNDLGQVAGSSAHAFLWSRDSGMMDLGFPGEASKVNNRTQVAGTMYGSPPQAFLWTDGHLDQLGSLYSGSGSWAYGLNNLAQVVGQSGSRAFLWTEQTGMKDLGTFDGTFFSTSGANAINDLGQIVGSSYSSAFGTSHAAYFTREGPIDLGTLGGYSEGSAVNNVGQVVGDSDFRAFLTDLNGGPMLDLYTLIPPDSGWVRLTSADGINDAGQIIGTGVLPGYDNVHAYLLTPRDDVATALATAPHGSPTIPNATAGLAVSSHGSVVPCPPPQDTELSTGSKALLDQPAAACAAPAGTEFLSTGLPQSSPWEDPLGTGSG